MNNSAITSKIELDKSDNRNSNEKEMKKNNLILELDKSSDKKSNGLATLITVAISRMKKAKIMILVPLVIQQENLSVITLMIIIIIIKTTKRIIMKALTI